MHVMAKLLFSQKLANVERRRSYSKTRTQPGCYIQKPEWGQSLFEITFYLSLSPAFDTIQTQVFSFVSKSNNFWNSKKVRFMPKGPSIKDVFLNFRFWGTLFPLSPQISYLKSTSECLLFGHFLYPPPSPFGKTSFMDGPLVKLLFLVLYSSQL